MIVIGVDRIVGVYTTVYCHILKRNTWEFVHGDTGGLYPFYVQNPLKYSLSSELVFAEQILANRSKASKFNAKARVHLAPDDEHDGTSIAQ